MSKIEEILNKYRDITRWPEYPVITEDEYIRAMKEYAEYYAKECLQIAAENATGQPCYDYSNRYCVSIIENEVNINKESITNIQLPDHE